MLLAGADREDRALGAEVGAVAAGLDLDEDEGAAVEGDDVELAVAGAGVALDDLPAGGGEPGGDEILGGAADPLARARSSRPTLGAARAGGARTRRDCVAFGVPRALLRGSFADSDLRAPRVRRWPA